MEPHRMSANLFNGLGNPVRLQIINTLHSAGRLSVNEVTERIGISQSNTSRHLLILKEAGAVEVECKENKRLYSLRPGVIRLLTVASEVCGEA